MNQSNTPAKVGSSEGLGLEPERATVRLTLADLGLLAATAERNGTTHNFPAVALQWAAGAQDEIQRLRVRLENCQSWIEEAVSYVGCESWSPSLLREGEDLLRRLKA